MWHRWAHCPSPTAQPSEAVLNATARLALFPLAAAAAGLVTAVLGMTVTAVVVNTVESGLAWTDLGFAILGAMLSAALGVVVWLVLLAKAARLLFPAGGRLGPVLISAAAVLGVVVLASMLVGTVGSGTGADPFVLTMATALAVLTVPSAVFVLRGLTGARPGPPPGWHR